MVFCIFQILVSLQIVFTKLSIANDNIYVSGLFKDVHQSKPTMEKKMTNNVVITVACGTDDPNRATRAIHLATVAHREGKNVTLFLLDEGVYLAKKGLIDNLKSATGDVADDLMTYLQGHGVPVLACTPCAKARGITENDLIDGARMGTAVELIHLACDATVISL